MQRAFCISGFVDDAGENVAWQTENEATTRRTFCVDNAATGVCTVGQSMQAGPSLRLMFTARESGPCSVHASVAGVTDRWVMKGVLRHVTRVAHYSTSG